MAVISSLPPIATQSLEPLSFKCHFKSWRKDCLLTLSTQSHQKQTSKLITKGLRRSSWYNTGPPSQSRGRQNKIQHWRGHWVELYNAWFSMQQDEDTYTRMVIVFVCKTCAILTDLHFKITSITKPVMHLVWHRRAGVTQNPWPFISPSVAVCQRESCGL